MLGDGGNLLRVHGDTGRIWDFDSKAFSQRTIPFHYEDHLFLFSNDRQLIAATGYGDDVFIYEVGTGSTVHALNPRSGAIQGIEELESVVALAFSADSTRLLTATSYGTMRVWDTVSGQLTTELDGPTDLIDKACFSPDSEVIASLHSDHIRLWDVITGQLIQEVDIQSTEDLAFSVNGENLLISSPHATYRWRIPRLPDEPERIRAWVDVLSVARWSEQGFPTSVGLSSWLESWKRLDNQGGPFQPEATPKNYP